VLRRGIAHSVHHEGGHSCSIVPIPSASPPDPHHRYSEELIELLFIASMRTFHLSIQLRRMRPDLDVPVELILEFVTAICADRVNAKKELLDDVIHELDCVHPVAGLLGDATPLASAERGQPFPVP